MDSLGPVLARARHWPLPGGGETLVRWSALAALAERDLVEARLAEAHVDALAILAELGEDAPAAETRWGVWAAEVPDRMLSATRADAPARWLVDGAKAWCSGATLLTHALVTARSGDERRLFAVDVHAEGVTPGVDAWASAGMKRADTREVCFVGVPAVPIGGPDAYLSRPGFWIGGAGVAACWYGGAAAVALPLRRRVASHAEPHAAAHLGAVDVVLGAARDVLRHAAREVDASPRADHARLARRVRGTVAQCAADVATHVGRALGPGPLATDPEHAARVSDLEVYVRQDHAERDLAALGLDVAASPASWSL